MQRIARFYLHQPMVSEPIEFFHSLFLSFYHRDPVTLWTIQEEDPSWIRFVTDRGGELMSGRLAGVETNQGFSSFTRELQDEIATGQGECAGCEFMMNCLGYFKWPRREYRCDGVKVLMGSLRDAVGEMRMDVASFHPPCEGEPL